MQTLIERGCGLDVHQATVVACLLMVRRDGKVQKQMRTFGTTTRELVSLREWLLSEGCSNVAMESTGVYWKPIYAILEGALEIVVANAQHIKKVPGRKTDVKDAEWIADLLCHGLLRSSFVPPKPIRELRDLMRYRRKLVESQAAERNRLLKVLETANIKLANVATDVFGMSGRLMLRALIAGKATPPFRSVLRLRIGVRRLRNLERPRRRDPTGGGWCSTVVVPVIREQRCRNAQRLYFDRQVLHFKLFRSENFINVSHTSTPSKPLRPKIMKISALNRGPQWPRTRVAFDKFIWSFGLEQSVIFYRDRNAMLHLLNFVRLHSAAELLD